MRLIQAEVPRVSSTTPKRGHQRGKAELDVQTDKKYPGAGYQEHAAHKLHERLRHKLIQLVGIVVQPRNQVACLVLVEECDGQILQFQKQSVSQMIQDSSADAAHRDDLYVAGQRIP
jgi:hypothetical protein